MAASIIVQKTCVRCGVLKTTLDFHKGASACKACIKIYHQQNYQESKSNLSKFEARKAKAAGKRRERAVVIFNYLLAHPCVDCGEPDPVVLEFDHRDGSDKVASISALAAKRTSMEAIQAEMAKCDVRCANCHRRRTAKQFNYIRMSIFEGLGTSIPSKAGGRSIAGTVWTSKGGLIYARVTYRKPDGKRKDIKRRAKSESHAREMLTLMVSQLRASGVLMERFQPS